MTSVVGIDLSLTSTGVAVVNHKGATAVQRVRSKAPSTPRNAKTGKPEPATLEQRHERLQSIWRKVVQLARWAELVVVEQPAFSAQGGQHHDRSGLWWDVVHELLNLGVPLVEVTPGAVKKYATGKGNAGKDDVLAAVVRRYAAVAEVGNNDEADALVLAAMGARHLGFPLEESLPTKHLEALEAVRWS